jgi:cell division protein FtsQ
MTELDRDGKQLRSNTDISRARKRKLKREGGLANSTQPGMPKKSSHSGRRVPAKSGPSMRERLAATNVNLGAEEISSIQSMLSSKLGLDKHNPATERSARKTSSTNSKRTTRSRSRKADAHFSVNPYEATTRTESQRASRQDHNELPRKSRRVYEARSEGPPPVMVRGGMGGMTFGRTASSKMHKPRSPKRRIDVPLNVPGAELRLPSIPFVHLGWKAVSLLMVIMLTLCLVLIWQAPVFQVSSVDAVGLQRLTTSDLNTVMKTMGKSIFTLDPVELNQVLQQAFPEFSKISVHINLPASVKVVVTERQPVIDWIQDGTETWVDAEGVSFPIRGIISDTLVRVEGHGTPPGTTPSTPEEVLTGDPRDITSLAIITKPTLRLSHELLSSILALSAKMPADTLLQYDSAHGLGWTDPMGWEVYFGEEDENTEMKLVVYQALVDRLKVEGIQPALISVEFVHAPYYRMER